tara:strand:- start:14063 stop:14197 length:135 start_codon:yes stop_codon:yes gene_type:complete
MSEDITLEDFYKWLDTYKGSEWEVVEIAEGVRWVRFIVKEDEDE